MANYRGAVTYSKSKRQYQLQAAILSKQHLKASGNNKRQYRLKAAILSDIYKNYLAGNKKSKSGLVYAAVSLWDCAVRSVSKARIYLS